MVPTADPQRTPAIGLDLALLALLVEQARTRLLTSRADDPLFLSRFGWSVLDHLELRPTDVVAAGASQQVVQKAYEEIGRRFLDVVLPAIEDIPHLDAKHVAEYLASIDPNRPVASRLSAAFGASRMRLFDRDRRLVYRSVGYRGRRGDPLADFLIEYAIRPVVVAAASLPTRDF
ncbi:hypothetical protein [Limnoglobus roseus]|uniref:Uncharacterized protein n=1 Tax=Limnoglobus roseus TaxID=2598579 RepID=A0A5C1AN90_9BACT|nr:hypothetical protein [Limnoglobus roseus]QEL19583.1 hypothetical protein PX52LOC_06659 [Limnoglobus roseus]